MTWTMFGCCSKDVMRASRSKSAIACEPTVGFVGDTVLVALRDIGPDQELTTDYALFDGSDELMHCQRRTPSCRGTISGRDWQRPDLQRSTAASYLQRRFADQADTPR